MGVLNRNRSGASGDLFFSSAEASQLNTLLRGSGPCVNVSGEAVSGQNSQGQDGGVAASEVYDLHQNVALVPDNNQVPSYFRTFSATHDARLAFTLRSRNRINARIFFPLLFPCVDVSSLPRARNCVLSFSLKLT
jgi:hypothetical protein